MKKIAKYEDVKDRFEAITRASANSAGNTGKADCRNNFTQSARDSIAGPATLRESADERTQPSARQSGQKPPPIHILTRLGKNYKDFRHKLDEISKCYYINFAGNNIILHFQKLADHRKFVETFNGEVPFHTYAAKEDRTFAYVMKGLDDNISVAEVKQALLDLEIPVIRTSRINTFYPMFLLIMPRSVSLEDLKKQATYINNIKVYYERYKNKKEIIQCKKCQMWEHASSNCYYNLIRCVKCAQFHVTTDCVKPREEAAKCCNCDGDHPASSTECPVYQELVEDRRRRMQRTDGTAGDRGQQTRYMDTPPSETNAWDRQRDAVGRTDASCRFSDRNFSSLDRRQNDERSDADPARSNRNPKQSRTHSGNQVMAFASQASRATDDHRPSLSQQAPFNKTKTEKKNSGRDRRGSAVRRYTLEQSTYDASSPPGTKWPPLNQSVPSPERAQRNNNLSIISGVKCLREISSCLADINRMINLRELARRLMIIRQKLRDGTSMLELIIDIIELDDTLNVS